MTQWQLHRAKARLSELVRSVKDEGPQEITVRGRPAAVLLSKADYDRLLQGHKPTLVEFLRESPLVGVDLKLRRDRSPARSVKL